MRLRVAVSAIGVLSVLVLGLQGAPVSSKVLNGEPSEGPANYRVGKNKVESRIAFVRYDPVIDNVVLWTTRPNGTDQRRVTAGPGTFPSWSPDRSKLLYDFPDEDGNQQIAVVSVDGTGMRQLTDLPGISEGAEFTADGKRIVFNRSPVFPDDPAFYTSLWIMNADGSKPRPLFTTDPAKFDVEPDISPDGRLITFNRLGVINGEFGAAVFVVDIDGKNERQITPMTVGLEHPQWVPDGRRVVYEIDHAGVPGAPDNGIWTVRLNGRSRLVAATTDEVRYLKPDFSPTGTRITARCERPGSYPFVEPPQNDLCVLRSNGTLITILDTPDFEDSPIWN